MGALCPCCGQPLPDSARLDAAVAEFGRNSIMGRILLALGKRPMHLDQLASSIYADDPDGGPLFTRTVICGTVSRNRAKLSQHGLRVVCRPERGRNATRYLEVIN